VTQISSLSTEYVRVQVTDTGAGGSSIDPTGDAVEMAFVTPGVLPVSGDWHTAAWETVSGSYFARILVGPAGTVAPPVGIYEVWVRIHAGVETPIQQSGLLTISDVGPQAAAGGFATAADLQSFMGVAIPEQKVATAEVALRAATSAIKRETRKMLGLVVDDVVELHPQGAPITIRVPETPVWWVKRIVLALIPGVASGIVITNFEVTQWGRIRWPLGDFSSIMAGAINAPTLEVEWAPLAVVTYTHGYLLPGDAQPELPVGATPILSFSEVKPLPDELGDLCMAVAARSYLNPQSLAQEQIGGSNTVYGDARGVTLTAEEQVQLHRWRVTSYGGGG
jgi:hypothetical protein